MRFPSPPLMLREHVRLHAQCGICGRPLLAGVNFMPCKKMVRASWRPTSLIWNSLTCLDTVRNSDLVHGIQPNYIESIRLQDHNQNALTRDGRPLCWTPHCQRCSRSPGEAVGIHLDCYNLFTNECKAENALERLWVAALARSPWKGAVLRLNPDADLAIGLVYEKAEEYGIPGLRSLPPELFEIIRNHSVSATFWRYVAALDFSRELSSAPDLQPECPWIPFGDLLAWKRGEESSLQLEDGSPNIGATKVVRLTIDSRGICQVERLPSRPPFQQWRSESVAFVIHEGSQLSDIKAVFSVSLPSENTVDMMRSNSEQHNTLRLELPEHIRGFHIWDMPNPPKIEDCNFIGHIAQSTRFRSIDLQGSGDSQVTGLTFFYSFSKIYAIHAHTPTAPYAEETWKQLSRRRRPNTAWAYLPMAKGDDILAFGVRLRQIDARRTTQKPCFLVRTPFTETQGHLNLMQLQLRTRLCGDIALGPHGPGEHSDIVLSRGPKLFIYNSMDLRPITIFGTFSFRNPDGSQTHDRTPLNFSPHWPPNAPSLNHQVFSSAPLKDITRIQIFGDPNGFTQAVIMDYKNGARRALGDCRLGTDEDEVETYENPTYVCCRSTGSINAHMARRSIRVVTGEHSSHCHEDDGAFWTCSAVEGHLEFWYSEEGALIALSREDHPMPALA